MDPSRDIRGGPGFRQDWEADVCGESAPTSIMGRESLGWRQEAGSLEQIRQELTPGAQRSLDNISFEILSAADGEGKTVLDHLQRLRQGLQLEDSSVRQDLMSAVIDGFSTQDQHTSCAAEPAEWTRILTDLVLSGESELRSGTVLKLPSDVGSLDQSHGRPFVDALLKHMAAHADEISNNPKDAPASGGDEEEGLTFRGALKDVWDMAKEIFWNTPFVGG